MKALSEMRIYEILTYDCPANYQDGCGDCLLKLEPCDVITDRTIAMVIIMELER